MSEMIDKEFNKPIAPVPPMNKSAAPAEVKQEKQEAALDKDKQMQVKFYDGQDAIVGKSQIGAPDNLNRDMQLFVSLASKNPKKLEQASLLYEKMYEELEAHGDKNAAEKAAYVAYGMFMKEFSKDKAQ